jgi:hypothetical protein
MHHQPKVKGLFLKPQFLNAGGIQPFTESMPS